MAKIDASIRELISTIHVECDNPKNQHIIIIWDIHLDLQHMQQLCSHCWFAYLVERDDSSCCLNVLFVDRTIIYKTGAMNTTKNRCSSEMDDLQMNFELLLQRESRFGLIPIRTDR